MQHLINEYNQGKSMRRLAKEYNMPYSAVRKWLIDTGTVTPGKARNNPTVEGRDKAIIEAWLANAAMSTIARQHNISRQRVHQILKREGVLF